MADDDEIILADLSDEDLVAQMFDDLYDGMKEEIEEGVNILIERKWAPYDVLTKALVGGMTIVGADFRDGILFVPEVLLAANAMKGGMAILKPLLAETGAPRVGKMVIGTVKGDIHDIGKNLVGMMMEGAGFEVIDLGINNSVEKYLDAITAEGPDILGMSALLTTTMPYMKVVIDTLIEKGHAARSLHPDPRLRDRRRCRNRLCRGDFGGQTVVTLAGTAAVKSWRPGRLRRRSSYPEVDDREHCHP